MMLKFKNDKERIAFLATMNEQSERKKGKWISVHPLQSDDPSAYMRSECKIGMWEIMPSMYHYCPNCGSDMRGERNDRNQIPARP